jgi:hypothetical protein
MLCIGFLHHLARKYAKVKIKSIFSRPGEHFDSEDVAKLPTTGKYILYAWKHDSSDDGHYIALVDGELKCDKVLKNQKCNVKPLTAKNVSSMFYRKSTSPIFVWNVEL